MSESYIRAEIVRPKQSGWELFEHILSGLLNLALVTLFLFWFVASWFPHLGLTYWQLVLPVFVIRALFGRAPFGRQLK